MILRALGVFVVFFVTSPLAAVYALPITGITHLNSFRDTRGVNDVGVAPGDINQFGADLAPSAVNTTVSAVQGTFTVGPNPCGPSELLRHRHGLQHEPVGKLGAHVPEWDRCSHGRYAKLGRSSGKSGAVPDECVDLQYGHDADSELDRTGRLCAGCREGECVR
jgi:hypothetical protein